jgi:hypothetical protein
MWEQKPKTDIKKRKEAKPSTVWTDEDKKFTLTNGRIKDCRMKFHIKRTRKSPALFFGQGEMVTLCYRRKFYDVMVSTFAPRTLVGSVVTASGEISFFLHDEVADIISNL